MAKKKTLGRGLSNLLPGTGAGRSTADAQGSANYRELKLSEIKPNPQQPRKYFDESEIEKLAQTLQTVGMIEPVVVRQKDETYELISGERRWRAAQVAGFKKIPAVLKQVNDVQALEMGIIENIQREELNPVEEARSYEVWMEQTKQKASDLAKKVGKDRSTITNLIRLLKLPIEVLDLVEKKMLSPGQARPLIGIGDRSTLHRLSQKIVREGWTARRVEEEIAKLQMKSAPTAARGGSKKDPNIKNLEDRLRRKLTAKVSIQHKKNGGGSITIHYANLDDMERVLEAMKIQ